MDETISSQGPGNLGCPRFFTAVRWICACVVLLLAGRAAHAQTSNCKQAQSPASCDGSTDQWHVDAAPYLWFPGINGTVGALGHQASIHVTPVDLLSNFNFGLMGGVEARHGRIVIPVDFMWVKLKDDKGIPFEQGVQQIQVKINEDIFTPKIGYRLVDTPRFTADALVGLRYWHYGTTLDLEPPVTENRHFYQAANWVDAVEGARFRFLLTPKTSVTIAGDAGGGGARLDYQVVGLIGYQMKRVTLQGGWRYLDIHKGNDGGFFVNTGMSGLIIGAVFRLK